MSEERLDRLRRRIRNLDAAMLGLMAERMELAREVGQEKRGAGIPLRDFEVEKRVLARAAASAEALGLAPELARGVMRQLVEEACRVQEIDHFSTYSGESESILVVGGAGKMGQWLVRFFETQGHRVLIHDPALAALATSEASEAAGGETVAALADGLAAASMVFVAVPLDRVAGVVAEIAGLGYRGVLCDVASVKEHLRPALDAARDRGVAVTSIHPMFGAGARTLSDKVICLCDCGVPAATERVAGLFRETAVTLVPLSLERHDEIASYVLGLSHFLNLLFARVLATSGLSFAELTAVGSTTFHSQFATTESVVRENPLLYYEIQKSNRFSERVYREIERASADWIGWVERSEPGSFAEAMTGLSAWLGGADRSG
ncbi:MAG: prephenate dehydrogenase/arogenate dehydrogenase family protein [Thermoanaerobaculia bacterium]|nr:prephenate dehydrogenase/arogenate dehydrogenase family protein [Thermoanaerobaculia bacterium]